jgi:rubrerythrin
MGFEYNADEILEMAEQIERNGARFYRRAAELARDEEVKNVLLDLAAWEDGHQKVFASMRQDLTDQQHQPTTFAPEHETSLYLQAMADGNVFDIRADPAEMLTGTQSKKEIFELAIGQEKNSIVFYLGLKEMVPRTLGKDKVDQIIKEEMGHIGLLNREIAAVAGNVPSHSGGPAR